MRCVVGELGLGDSGGEQMQAEKLVPHEIIFFTPRAGLIEGEFVMIAVNGQPLPLRCHIFCGGEVVVGDACVAEAARHK
jgi:hypothetical protein